MNKFKFNLVEESRENKVFLIAEYAGGDADTEHPQEYPYDFLYSDINKEENVAKIQEDIRKFSLLKNILDVNSSKFLDDYDKVKVKYGEDIANLFDSVPNDPQNDYQDKCYLDSIKLMGYDEGGTKFETYDLL